MGHWPILPQNLPFADMTVSFPRRLLKQAGVVRSPLGLDGFGRSRSFMARITGGSLPQRHRIRAAPDRVPGRKRRGCAPRWPGHRRLSHRRHRRPPPQSPQPPTTKPPPGKQPPSAGARSGTTKRRRSLRRRVIARRHRLPAGPDRRDRRDRPVSGPEASRPALRLTMIAEGSGDQYDDNQPGAPKAGGSAGRPTMDHQQGDGDAPNDIRKQHALTPRVRPPPEALPLE